VAPGHTGGELGAASKDTSPRAAHNTMRQAGGTSPALRRRVARVARQHQRLAELRRLVVSERRRQRRPKEPPVLASIVEGVGFRPNPEQVDADDAALPWGAVGPDVAGDVTGADQENDRSHDGEVHPRENDRVDLQHLTKARKGGGDPMRVDVLGREANGGDEGQGLGTRVDALRFYFTHQVDAHVLVHKRLTADREFPLSRGAEADVEGADRGPHRLNREIKQVPQQGLTHRPVRRGEPVHRLEVDNGEALRSEHVARRHEHVDEVRAIRFRSQRGRVRQGEFRAQLVGVAAIQAARARAGAQRRCRGRKPYGGGRQRDRAGRRRSGGDFWRRRQSEFGVNGEGW
jgi:hypothetical protein